MDEKQNRQLLILGESLVAILIIGIVATVASGNVSIVGDVLGHAAKYIQDNAIIVPIVNVARALLTGLYMMVSTHLDSTNPLFNRVRDNVYTLSSTLTTIIAQSILVATVGVVNPTTAILFILGSFIDLFKEIHAAYKNWEKCVNHPLYTRRSSGANYEVEACNICLS